MTYFWEGLLLGFAVLAPIGMQNLFIVNTALVQKVSRIVITILIVAFFDITLSVSAFYGIGAIFDIWPFLKGIILLLGGAVIFYMGYTVFNSEPQVSHMDTNVTIWNIVTTAFAVAWLNPQALIDVTMMFGAVKASIPEDAAIYFLLGYIVSAFAWFGTLSTIIHKLAKRIQISQLIWINRICGLILFGSGAKLFLDGVIMYI